MFVPIEFKSGFVGCNCVRCVWKNINCVITIAAFFQSGGGSRNGFFVRRELVSRPVNE